MALKGDADIMTLAEAPRIYPVFTWHANELRAAASYLIRRMEKYANGHKPDARFAAMLNRHQMVISTLAHMEHTKDQYVYLTREERELVGRVNAWLKEHPEHREA